MENYLQPQDDDLPMRPSGPWAIEKLDYLERYINTFTTSMRDKPWRGIHYIDLFAGPGKCRIGDTHNVHLGSPLIALQASYPFTGYFFVDLESDNIAALQQRCSASPAYNRVQCFVGDSNVVVQEIVERISAIDREYIPGRWRSSLNLAFLDPPGLDLNWDTVAALARFDRMDLIIHYPQMGLERYMPRAFEADGQTRVDLFFGGVEWRGIYETWRDKVGLHRQLMDYYKGRLLKLGYVEAKRDDETGGEPLMRNAEKRAPLYRLLFASEHRLGDRFWQAITRRDVHGQARLF